MTGIVRHPWGPRVYLAGRRVHHGSAGCALALVGVARHNAWLGVIAGAMIAHDAGDFPWRDCDNHCPSRAPAGTLARASHKTSCRPRVL